MQTFQIAQKVKLHALYSYLELLISVKETRRGSQSPHVDNTISNLGGGGKMTMIF